MHDDIDDEIAAHLEEFRDELTAGGLSPEEAARAAAARFGNRAAIADSCRRFPGWRAGFLVGSPQFEQLVGRALGRPRIKKPLANANLRAYFYLYEL
jgi:hypothetical protein